MNLSNLKYVIEVEKTKSITKAAQNFYMNQPHLSKIIREMERELGCPIFDRTSHGMVPTEMGMQFLRYAKSILVQLEQLESLCGRNRQETLRLRLSVPRASYISTAFAELLNSLSKDSPMDIHYMETNSRDTIRGVSSKAYDMGIIRYPSVYESYYRKMLQEENLEGDDLWEFSCVVLVSRQNPLASGRSLTYLDLAGQTELSFGDTPNPAFSFEPDIDEKSDLYGRQFSIYDRASQFELLRRIPLTYIWCSPIPKDMLKFLDLAQLACSRPGNLYKDVIICRRGYRLSPPEQKFVAALRSVLVRITETA